MAKIDDSVKKKVPELRFKGFTDEWEQRKLGDEVRIVMGQSPNSENYTDDPNDYILVQGNADMKNGRVFPRVWTTQVTKQAEKDDLILSVRAPVGDIGKTVYDVVIGRGVAAIKGNEFIFQNLGKMKSDGYWTRYSTGSTFESINSTDIKEAIISVPAIEEQDKIGSFFKQLDNTIALHQRKLDLLKEQKKGYLQKMFPKNGAKVPELRFAGFADDWVQRNLGEWSDVRDGTHASPKYIEQGHPMVTSKNLTDSGLDMSDVSYLTDEDFNEVNQRSKVDIGDILFGMIGTIGKPVIVDRDDFAIKNVALIKEKTSPEIINTWLIQYLKSPSFERFIQKENAGGTQKFIALGLIRDMKLMTPSVQEQARIGELLNHLDNLIAANQRKLDLLKEQKKGFLQNMFV